MEKKFNIESLKGRNPMKTPEGYFESLTSRVMSQIPSESVPVAGSVAEPSASSTPKKKVVGLMPHRRNRKWLKWTIAAAACICGVALFLTNQSKEDEGGQLASTKPAEKIQVASDEEDVQESTVSVPVAKQYANNAYDLSTRRKSSAYSPEPARNYQYAAYTPVKRVSNVEPEVKATSSSPSTLPSKSTPAVRQEQPAVSPSVQSKPSTSLASTLENMNDYDVLDYTQMSGSEIYDYLAGNEYY